LPDELLEEIKKMAEKRDISASDMMRIACEKYLAAVKKAEITPAEPKNEPQ
jgi:metal-responsive CopG/Arc/MetJ family transcriptional regulator